MQLTREWSGRWIKGTESIMHVGSGVLPAPYVRKTFDLEALPNRALAYVCAPGWHELYVNGQKVDDRVLAPTVSQFDRHVGYIEYDITGLLRQGSNALVALLGNGLYNCHTEEVWNFAHACWRDYPKIICDVVADGETLVKTDASWKTAESPLRFDGFRNGEVYDCTYEIPGFADPSLDDSSWAGVTLCDPPAGIPILEQLEPTRVCRRYPVKSLTKIAPDLYLADFGTALTGWLSLTVKTDGTSAEKPHVSIQYTELKRWNDMPDDSTVACYIKSGECQTDHLYLKQKPGTTTYEPRFTYHGFRYAYIRCWTPGVTIGSVEACFVHNDFPQTGSFQSSDPMLNALQKATVQSYLCNFTGIPTDCPHREKNGWTGDAQLAMETGLWNFNGTKAYTNFMQILTDGQRPSGQFSGIAPSAGWGYNWGSGPAWDSVLFEAAWQLKRFHDDETVIREFYPNMKRYLDYCRLMSNDNLVSFGLGDWCPVDPAHKPSTLLTSSAFVYLDARRFATFAKMLGKEEDCQAATAMAESMKASIRKTFLHADGTWEADQWTTIGCILYFGLCEPEEAQPLADRLVQKVRANGHKVDFGILGAKWVPRTLADYGYAEDAYRLITQPEFPGWGQWIKRGATTLWENWDGNSSLNHIMFGDISAWMYEYLAGIKPEFNAPAFRHFAVKPQFVSSLECVDMDYQAPNGTIHVDWKRLDNGTIRLNLTVPQGSTATVILPTGTTEQTAGQQTYTIG